MRELVIGDLHFGIKNNSISWLESQLDFFHNQIFPILKDKDINRCIFLGDLTDIRYSINQQIGIELKKLFREILNEFPKIDFYLLAGNHDYYSPLEEFVSYNSYELIFGQEFVNCYDNLFIISEEPFLTEDGALLLPWYYTENSNHIDEILYNFDFTFEVKEIFCHTDLSTWPGPRIAAFKGCPIYSGHIHYEYTDTIGNLYNLGSACSFTFSDVNSKKYIYIMENYKIVERIENITTPSFKRLYNEEIFDATEEIFNNSYVQLCISSQNINKAQYVEKIKDLKTTYLDSNIRLHVIDDDDNYTTLSVATFNTNIETYINNNIPKHLNNKYEIIKNQIQMSK